MEFQMAAVNFFVPTNMATSQTFAGTLTGATSSQITITDGFNTGIYQGQFTYSSTGQVSGTLLGYEQFAGSLLTEQVTGLHVDMSVAAGLINSNQVQALFQLALQGNDVIIGSSGNDVLFGYGGNDVIAPGGGNNTVDAGAGFDTVVIHAPIETSTIAVTGNLVQVAGSEGNDTITNAERIQFSNGVLALDTQGSAGNAYRLYQAAFNRTPDTAGLSFWTHQLDLGLNIQTVAQDFVNSSEFKTVYGANPTNAQIVNLFYGNVLGRAGETAGINFWVGQLNAGTSVGAVLEGFAVSSENHGIVDPKIAQGILLDHTAFLV
jgi:Ca2+-binding RTX toxin-like protein